MSKAISEDLIAEVAYELLSRASVEVSEDLTSLLEKAYNRERHELAKVNLKTMLEALKIAKEERRPICQDTGIPYFYVTIGGFARIKGDIKNALEKATAKATKTVPLRENVVNPLTNENPGTNVGWGIPYTYFDYEPEADYLELMAVPRGGGSALVTQLIQLPTIGPRLQLIKKGILNSVVAARERCPPFIIGVCVGGYFDIAVKEAERALFRNPLGAPNPNSNVAKIERELLEAVNKLGIGPMGLGGDTTALALHMEIRGSHTARPAVAVAFSCWVLRRATARIYLNGKVEYLTTKGEKGWK